MYDRPKVYGSRPGASRVVRWLLVVAALAVLAAGVFLWFHYQRQLRPISNSQEVKIVDIEKGTAAAAIASELETQGLIRSGNVFQLYIRFSGQREKLQAGTYALQPSMSVLEIVDVLVAGQVKSELLTILPGQRIDQVRRGFINAGFKPEAVDVALDPASYAGHPVLADKPAGTNSLEGFLFPESYQKTGNTDPSVIVRQSLDLMAKQLTPDIRAAFAGHGLSVYQGVTLASIVEKEVNNPADASKVAQVFLKRLKSDIALGSDPTTLYGSVLAGLEPTLRHSSPYNTHQNKGLPPTPISNAGKVSLQAVADPATTDWLFFVAGDDGTTYFSKTVEEHEALTDRYCKRLCSATP